MMVVASVAREIALKAKESDVSLEIAYEKILKRAKCGLMNAEISINKEHIDDVCRRLSCDGYKVRISQQGVYYNTLHISWGTEE